jgi:hypothetical protein
VSFVFRFEAHCDKLNLVEIFFNAYETWMFCKRGEGEEEIKYQGWSRVKEVSSQGTICKGQLKGPKVLRMSAHRSTQKTELSAGCTINSDSTPLFLPSKIARIP